MFLIVNISSSIKQVKKTFIYFVCILQIFCYSFRAFASLAYAYNKYNSTLVIINKMIGKKEYYFLENIPHSYKHILWQKLAYHTFYMQVFACQM